MPLAASLERAVTDSAELLLAAGAVLALAYGLTRTRIGVLRWPLLGVALLALGAGTALGGWAWHEKQPRTVVGSPTEEFSNTLRDQPKKSKPSEKPSVELTQVQWPTYGYDIQRTHLAPDWRNLRPPYHGLWKLKARGDIEFPPSVAYRKVYVAQQKGRFYAVNARTGKIVWTKHFPNCSAASADDRGRDRLPGVHARAPVQQARDGRRRGSSSPGTRRTVGSSGACARAPSSRRRSSSARCSTSVPGTTTSTRTGPAAKRRPLLQWTFARRRPDRRRAPASAGNLVIVATSSGSVYGVDRKTGRERWHATSFSRFGSREYFYATPTVAYGRVFIGNADGTVYAFGANSGHLLWARQVGTYVYTAAAVWRKTVFVGTWDGNFVALDARTGNVRWRYDAPASITGAPTVLAGLVYFSTCGRCGAGGLRRVKNGPRGTWALNARNGDPVWHFPDGKYSALVADGRRIYISGRNKVYALIPQAALGAAPAAEGEGEVRST